MNHLLSKYNKDQHVDINKEHDKFKMNPDPNKALTNYFKVIQVVQERLKDTEEPIREPTMKRTVIRKFCGLADY